jgi:hypothetical protein
MFAKAFARTLWVFLVVVVCTGYWTQLVRLVSASI